MTEVALLARLTEFFIIGVATPLTAACVVPLYPSFLAFLASGGHGEGPQRSVAALGALVVAGVLSFLAVVGFVVTTVLQRSMTGIVETVSPLAFAVLGGVGAVLLVAPTAFARLPAVEPPQTTRPALSAYGYGAFFGAIVLPCNPGTIALFFARVPVLFDSTAHSMLGFLAFGLGIGAPLLAFALAAEPFSRRVTRTLAAYHEPINRATGFVLLAVASYYLFVIFAVVPLL
jgi:cytochrome c-type biogenesis protein